VAGFEPVLADLPGHRVVSRFDTYSQVTGTLHAEAANRVAATTSPATSDG
jgi:hypothetical protein